MDSKKELTDLFNTFNQKYLDKIKEDIKSLPNHTKGKIYDEAFNNPIAKLKYKLSKN